MVRRWEGGEARTLLDNRSVPVIPLVLASHLKKGPTDLFVALSQCRLLQ